MTVLVSEIQSVFLSIFFFFDLFIKHWMFAMCLNSDSKFNREIKLLDEKNVELQQIVKVNINLTRYALLILYPEKWWLICKAYSKNVRKMTHAQCIRRSVHSSFVTLMPFIDIFCIWVGFLVSFLRFFMYVRSVPLIYSKVLPMGRCVINTRIILAGEHGHWKHKHTHTHKCGKFYYFHFMEDIQHSAVQLKDLNHIVASLYCTVELIRLTIADREERVNK